METQPITNHLARSLCCYRVSSEFAMEMEHPKWEIIAEGMVKAEN